MSDDTTIAETDAATQDDVAEAEAPAVETPATIDPNSAFASILAQLRAKVADFPATPIANETEQHYIERIIKGISDLEDDSWKLLSPDAQSWFNTQAANFEAKEKDRTIQLVPPAGYIAGSAPARVRVAKAGLSGLAAFNARRKEEREAAIARGEIPPKAARETKAREPKQPKGDGIGATIRHFVIQNFGASLDDLRAHLQSIGRGDITPTSVSTFRSDALATLALAKQLGYYTGSRVDGGLVPAPVAPVAPPAAVTPPPAAAAPVAPKAPAVATAAAKPAPAPKKAAGGKK